MDFGYACHKCEQMVGELTRNQAEALANAHRIETRKENGGVITNHAGIIEQASILMARYGYPFVSAFTHIGE